MSSERRYGDDEVAEIFKAATTSRGALQRRTTTAAGFTLSELQSIGREAGIPPQRIEAAAAELEIRKSALPVSTHLGLPVGVGRSIELPRAPTDREWEILVSELRETFRARGKVASQDGIRQWTNGNLHAYIEPTEAGYRLRMGTLKGDAAVVSGLGIAAVAVGGTVAAISAAFAADFVGPAMLGGMGLSTLAFNAIRLPRWSRNREQQMDYIAARARALITGAGQGERERIAE